MNRGLTKYLFFTIWGFGCSNLPLFFQFEPNWLSKHLSYSSVIQLRRPSIVKAFSHIWLCQIMFLDFVKWLFHFLFNLRTLTFVTGSAIANSRQSFLKIGHPRPLFRLFLSFHSNIRILTTNKCPSSIQCWDSNPQPLEHESPPITTRPEQVQSSNQVTLLVTFVNLKESDTPWVQWKLKLVIICFPKLLKYENFYRHINPFCRITLAP